MNKYLWDKSGSDPEIEELEQTLAVYSSKDAPQEGLVLEAEHRGIIAGFKLKLGLASLVTASLAVVVAFFVTSSEDLKPVALETPKEPTVRAKPLVEKVVPFKKFAVAEKRKPETDQRTPRVKRSLKTRAISKKTVVRKRKRITKRMKTSQKPVLTPEEREAYNQLMTALAITSKNLSLVKDRIDGSEKQKDPGSKE